MAYDRNDQPHMAMQTLETISAEEITDWRQKVQSGAVFYSPPDEYDYYEGLIAEFQGDLSTSLEQYSTFLKKTGTSAYVQRASEHVSDLARRLATNLAHANAL